MARRSTNGVKGILAGLLLAAIAGCGGGNGSISGLQATQYTLYSIDGHALPYKISQSSDGTVTTTVTDMILTVIEDKTWGSVGHETVTTNGVPSTEVFRNSGSYATSAVPGPYATEFRDSTGNLVWLGGVTESDVRLTGSDSLVWVFQR